MKKFFMVASAIICIFFFTACGEKTIDVVTEKAADKVVVTAPAPAKIPERNERKEQADQIRARATENSQPIQVSLSSLRGRKVADLYAKFLGISDGLVPESAAIDFQKNLAHLWAGKIERIDSSSSTQENVSKILLYYQTNKNRMSIKEFVALAGSEIVATKKSISWPRLCFLERLTLDRCSILQAISKNIVGKDLVAYGMTEIFPAADGRLNVAFLDILLRQAGAEYVDSLPAIHDGYLSFGLYQFTSFAVYDTGTERRGASIPNQAVTGKARIPGSMVALRNGDHHRAAYLFAIHNVATLLRLASDKEVKILRKFHGKHQDEMVQFIAIAHHLPGPAIKGARRWITHGMRKNLRVSLGKVLGQYATKTEENLLALYAAIK